MERQGEANETGTPYAEEAARVEALTETVLEQAVRDFYKSLNKADWALGELEHMSGSSEESVNGRATERRRQTDLKAALIGTREAGTYLVGQRGRAQRQEIARVSGVRESARKAARRAEVWAVAGLFTLAVIGYVVASFATRGLLGNIQQGRFSPSDTAQLVTAIGGLTTAVGLSVAGVVKALALLVHARADMVRARAGLPPSPQAEESVSPVDGEPTQ
ncbi:hypothetical protein AB0J38_17400 [Streptomyces sp. NPDC050095]|uniref:hypothetical protein n=1 Tax=unclassified Streptomyces TaxID=2593676 RepID=UPI0034333140